MAQVFHGSRSPCHNAASVIVKSREGGLVTQNCTVCGKRRSLKYSELPTLKCSKCNVLLTQGVNGNKNYAYTCKVCDSSWVLADLVFPWQELFDKDGKFRPNSNSQPKLPTKKRASNANLNTDILGHVKQRRITRLVHFTRIESLENIIDDREIRSRERCRTHGRRCKKNDRDRLDQHLDYICYSIEYPNVIVLDKYSRRFPGQEWIILFLQPILLGHPTTKFSPVNAATDKGAHVKSGIEGFQTLFDRHVGTKHPQYRKRGHLIACPTDVQAEVLVKDAIPIRYITEVAVRSDLFARKVKSLLDKWPNTQRIAAGPNRPAVRKESFLFKRYETIGVIKGLKP